MAKDSVYVLIHEKNVVENKAVECNDIPTESDITRVNSAPPQVGSVALIGVVDKDACTSTCTKISVRRQQ